MPLKVKAIFSFETSGNDTPAKRRHNPEAFLSHTTVKPEDTRHVINFASCWATDCRKICNGRIWKHLKGSGCGLFELSRYLPSYRVKKRQTWVLTARDLNLVLSAYDVALRVSTESFANGICGRYWKADRPVNVYWHMELRHCAINVADCTTEDFRVICHRHPAHS